MSSRTSNVCRSVWAGWTVSALFAVVSPGCGPSRDLTAELANATVDSQPVIALELGAPASDVTFSPDGKTLVTCTFEWDDIAAWDVSTGQQRWTLREKDGSIYSAAFTPDGKTFYAGLAQAYGGDEQFVKAYDAVAGAETKVIGRHEGFVDFVALLPDGNLLSAGHDGMAHVWSVDGEPFEVRKWRVFDSDSLAEFAISADGATLATMPATEKITFWDVKTGTKKIDLPDPQSGDWADGMVFLPNSGILLVMTPIDDYESETTTYRFDEYDPESGRRTSSWTLGNVEYGWSEFAVSPDGRLLACASQSQKEIVVWDLGSRRIAVRLQGHENVMHCLGFSSDGRQLASGSEDGTVRIWNMPPVP